MQIEQTLKQCTPLPYRLAVYGTLKKGFGNHHFLRNAVFEGTYELQGYDMYSLGCFPGIKKGEGTITIEVYHIDEDMLENIDMLEGYDREEGARSFYLRREINIQGMPTFIYIFNHSLGANPMLVESGNWE